MKLAITKGTASKLIQIFIMDSSQTDGRGLTGLVFNTANLSAYYYREGAASPVQINLVTMVVGTWASGGFAEIHAANMPGWYQVGLPDAALLTGADSVGVMLKGAADMAPVNAEFQLTEYELGNEASDIWDELLTGATHNIPTSAGRRLRGIQEFQGYELGSIWIDTVNGTAGTVDYENGTVENPVDSLTDALVLAASLNIERFQITPGSTLTLDAGVAGKYFNGQGWTLALGNQDCSGAIFIGATVSGVCTSDGTSVHFHDCFIGTCTLPAGHFYGCAIGSTVTLSAVGDYFFDACYHSAAGTAVPTIDLGAAVGNTNLHLHHYSGGVEIENMGGAGTDVMHLGGDGQLTINANCSGGTIIISGTFTVTDNASGAVTLSDDARYDTEQINAEVVDVMRTDTVAEIAAVPAKDAPLHSMLQWVFTIIRNKRITTADLDTLRNDADDADIATAPLTHTATSFTRGKYS